MNAFTRPLLTLLLTGTLAQGAVAQASVPSTPPSPPATPSATPATPTQPTPTPPTPPTPAAPAPSTTPPPTPDPQTVVAKVGEEEITLAEFDSAFRVAVARIVNNQGMAFKEELFKDFAEGRSSYLQQLARDRAVAQLARAGVKASPAEIEAQYKKARGNFKSDEEFVKALEGIGYPSVEAFRAGLEKQALLNAYFQALLKQFTFQDSALKAHYNSNKKDYTREAQACVRHILVKQETEARSIAQSLKKGGNFAQLAKQKSQDPGSAAKGGDLGCIAPGDTVPPFDQASFKGPVGQVQVVKSEYGWHVLQVNKRIPAGLAPYAEVATKIREQLSQQAAQKYLDAQIAKIKIETFADRLK